MGLGFRACVRGRDLNFFLKPVRFVPIKVARMSTISSLISTTGLYSSYPATSPTGSAPVQQNLGPIGVAPQSGNLSAAQKALAAVQDGLASNASESSDSGDSNDPTSSTEDPYVDNSEAAADYDAMVKDLQSGNLTAAQKDYATLQTDLKVHGVHHHGGVRHTLPTIESASTDSSAIDGASGNLVNVTV